MENGIFRRPDGEGTRTGTRSGYYTQFRTQMYCLSPRAGHQLSKPNVFSQLELAELSWMTNGLRVCLSRYTSGCKDLLLSVYPRKSPRSSLGLLEWQQPCLPFIPSKVSALLMSLILHPSRKSPHHGGKSVGGSNEYYICSTYLLLWTSVNVPIITAFLSLSVVWIPVYLLPLYILFPLFRESFFSAVMCIHDFFHLNVCQLS